MQGLRFTVPLSLGMLRNPFMYMLISRTAGTLLYAFPPNKTSSKGCPGITLSETLTSGPSRL